tara:strand:- start:974 stop:1201 length:228 start_codon:yes stop_codon:yes gene_type:complete
MRYFHACSFESAEPTFSKAHTEGSLRGRAVCRFEMNNRLKVKSKIGVKGTVPLPLVLFLACRSSKPQGIVVIGYK